MFVTLHLHMINILESAFRFLFVGGEGGIILHKNQQDNTNHSFDKLKLPSTEINTCVGQKSKSIFKDKHENVEVLTWLLG